MKKYFLSCDWGTTAFRLRLIDTSNHEVVSEITSLEGIARTFQAWKASDMPANDRERFFKYHLKHQITALENQVQKDLTGVDIVISGMASSSIGMVELPYARLPFDLSGHEAILHKIERNTDFQHDILLISGVRSDDDVMRGEETQLIGLINLLKLPITDDFVFVLPGTHSKHVYIEKGHIVRFHTFMTGEMFQIISNHSILKDSIELVDLEHLSPFEWAFFTKGVQDTEGANMLNLFFKIRTNQLFNKCTKKENALYLSGLLMGSELRELVKNIANPDNLGTEGALILCSGNNLFTFYQSAIVALGLSERTIIVPPDMLDKAVVFAHKDLVA